MTGRWVSASNESEAVQPSVVLVTLVDLDFAGGHVRVHDGLGSLALGGNTYLGVGTYGGVEQVSEDLEVSAKGLRLTLSGVPADMVPDVLVETNYQNRAATLYVGLLDRSTNAFVATPEEVWSGLMDYMEVTGGLNECSVAVTVEDNLRREPVLARYSTEDQQSVYAGDSFFNDLPNVANHRSTWGQQVQLPGGGGGGGVGGPGGPRTLPF